MPVCLDFRPTPTFLFFLSFSLFFFFLFSFLLFSSLFVWGLFPRYFLSFCLSSTVCLFEEVVMYRIFEEIGEGSEVLSRGKVR